MTQAVFLFPAFVLKYKGDEVDFLKQQTCFDDILSEISNVTGTDLRSFDINANNFLDNELKNQLMTYVMSTCSFGALREKYAPSLMCGMSMGLYAALYAAGFISLKDGAILIKNVYSRLKSCLQDERYGMTSVIGLSKDEINQIIETNHLECEIVIKNSEFSFVVAGKSMSLNQFTTTAQTEGALHAHPMPVTVAYHTRYIKNANISFDDIISEVAFRKNEFPLFSSVNMRRVTTIEAVKQELYDNISKPVDWYESMKMMLAEQYKTFVECGPGNSLKRISKFIEGDYRIVTQHSKKTL